MRRSVSFAGKGPTSRRGHFIIEILVVLLIILLLYFVDWQGLLGNKKAGGVSVAIDSALDTLEAQQDRQLETNMIANPQDGDRRTTGAASLNRPAPTATPASQNYVQTQIGYANRARRLKAAMDVKALNDNLMLWSLSHPDTPVTIENLRNTGFQFFPLKEGQEYVIINNQIRVQDKQ